MKIYVDSTTVVYKSVLPVKVVPASISLGNEQFPGCQEVPLVNQDVQVTELPEGEVAVG